MDLGHPSKSEGCSCPQMISPPGLSWSHHPKEASCQESSSGCHEPHKEFLSQGVPEVGSFRGWPQQSHLPGMLYVNCRSMEYSAQNSEKNKAKYYHLIKYQRGTLTPSLLSVLIHMGQYPAQLWSLKLTWWNSFWIFCSWRHGFSLWVALSPTIWANLRVCTTILIFS